MKKNLTRNAMVNAMVALLGVAVWDGAAFAAEPVYKRSMYYTGERDFCLRLLNNADKAEKIQPVIGPSYTFDLGLGENHAPRTRLYFVKSPMPDHVIYRMVKDRNWKAVLGFTPWKADSTAGRMVYDSRWRKYDDQCPGIFRIRHHKDRNRIIDTPTQMTLFDFDADGDGKLDMIYRHQFDYISHYFAVADFETCTLKPIIGHRADSELFRFEGGIYVISDSAMKVDSVYRIQKLNRKIDPNDHTCRFSGANPITNYPRDRHLNHKFTYRR